VFVLVCKSKKKRENSDESLIYTSPTGNYLNSLAPSVGTTCDVSLQKSAMVNTRSETNRVSRDAQNAREEGNSNDPQITRLNERIEQMAKSIEDLATMNAIL
jgi:hypothetical protein